MRGALGWLALICLTRSALAADATGVDELRRGLALTEQPAEARAHFERAAEAFRSASPEQRHHFLLRSRAEYLAGRLADAICTCRAGLTRDPGSLELRRQLAFLHEKVAGTRSPADFEPLPGFPRMPSSALCAVGFGIAWLAGWLCVACAWGNGASSWRGRAIASFVVAAAFGGLWLWHYAIRSHEQREPLLVIARDFQRLHQGNGESYHAPQDVPPMRIGMELRLLAARGDWLKVRRPDGVQGWLPRAAVVTEAERR